MKVDFSKEWCLRAANIEVTADCDIDAGIDFYADISTFQESSEDSSIAEANVAFGRFVNLMRRRSRLSIEKLAEGADIDISELIEIEEDAHHRPEPRTVFQLANVFSINTDHLMQIAGLSTPRDSHLYEEAVRFAARSDTVEELSDTERAALEEFVRILSERQ